MCDVAVPRLELSRLTQPQQIPENTVYQPAKSPPKSFTKSPCKKHKFFMGSRTQAPNENETPEAGEGCKPACVPDMSCNPACACRAYSQAMRCCCMIRHENSPQDRPPPRLCGGEGCHALRFREDPDRKALHADDASIAPPSRAEGSLVFQPSQSRILPLKTPRLFPSGDTDPVRCDTRLSLCFPLADGLKYSSKIMTIKQAKCQYNRATTAVPAFSVAPSQHALDHAARCKTATCVRRWESFHTSSSTPS